MQQREGPRRDGACEHGVLQQRAAGEVPLHEPARDCVLMHVGVAQARTRLHRIQERQRVSPAVQVRDGCDMMPAYSIYSLCVLRRRILDENICRQREVYGAF